jgi:hypothetical protein
MSRLLVSLALVPAILAATANAAHAAEGKWTPDQVLEHGPRWLRAHGFELPLAKLWDARAGTGLLANVVQLPGCSGSFVSGDGLLVTNHHCVVSVLQQLSTPERNLVAEGFLAATRADERPAKAYRILVPRAFRDVTAEMTSAGARAGADDAARARAVEDEEKALVAACEARAATRCQLATFDGGVRFSLTEFEELDDVRLVWAPPGALGDFGGEVDNWSWPRHTADVALLRAWKDGAPYRPRHVFPVSARGVRPGDAVAVLGYPAVSWRTWLGDEVAERQERFFPAWRALHAEYVRVLEEEGARSGAAAIAAAQDLRSAQNRRKNAEGQLAGLARGRHLERRRAEEARVLAFARARPGLTDAVAARDALVALAAERLATWDRDFLLDAIAGPSAAAPYGQVSARALAWPVIVSRLAAEERRPPAERRAGFTDRDLARLREELAKDQQRFSPAADARLFEAWVRRALALPAGQRIAAVDAAFGGLDAGGVARRIRELSAGSRLVDAAARVEATREPPAALAARAAREDPLLALGLALDAERRALEARRDRRRGAELRLRPAWRRAVVAEAGRPVAHDANRSLRVTFGRVAGYAPREAVTFAPQTTLAGVVAKHTGEPPFDAPRWLLEAAREGSRSRFADPVLRGVPVNFLSDCDTTGGNSGSPTVDGRGRLVGVNFDRVWENVANDFGYDPAVARNVNTDARYMLWLLERQGAAPLLRELLDAPAGR